MTDQKHIKRLAEIVQRQGAEREQDREREKKRTERQRTIAQAPTPWETEFYCVPCEADFKRMSHKVVITAYAEPIAFYEAKCPKNLHVCRRRITDKTSDPYYEQSRATRKARVELEIDMLQPDDPRFKRYYGDPMKKRYEELEKKEREAWQAKRDNP